MNAAFANVIQEATIQITKTITSPLQELLIKIHGSYKYNFLNIIQAITSSS